MNKPCSSQYIQFEMKVLQIYAALKDLAAFVKENPPSPAGEEKPLRLGGEDLRSTSKTGKVESSSLAATKKLPKLFMSLGTKDPLVRYRWGQSTFDQLRVCDYVCITQTDAIIVGHLQ